MSFCQLLIFTFSFANVREHTQRENGHFQAVELAGGPTAVIGRAGWGREGPPALQGRCAPSLPAPRSES